MTRFDKDGNQVWARQFGTNRSEEALGLAVLTNGHPVVAGYTEGTLFGHAAAGEYDTFVAVFPAA